MPPRAVAIPIQRQSAILTTAVSQKRNSFLVAYDIRGSPGSPPHILHVSPTELVLIEARTNNGLNDAKLPNRLPILVGSVAVNGNAFRSSDERFRINISSFDDYLLINAAMEKFAKRARQDLEISSADYEYGGPIFNREMA